jgi:hypothetical protein
MYFVLMRAPVVCRHDGTLVVPANHRVYRSSC